MVYYYPTVRQTELRGNIIFPLELTPNLQTRTLPQDIHSKLYTKRNVMSIEDIFQLDPTHVEIVS